MDNRYQQIAQNILQGQRVRRVTALGGGQLGQVWTDIDGLQNIECASKPPFVFNDPQTGVPMLYEELCQQKVLLICGGGHVSVAVAQLGKLLGYRVWVVDDRPEFASPQRFPQADVVTCAAFSDYLQSFDWQGMPDLSVVIVTRGHAADAVCLRQAVTHDLTYIGMIGSKRKNQAVFDLLRTEGITEEQLATVHAPIGLSIGAETPEEIAVAIAAQLIETRRTSANAGLSEAMLTALADGQTGIMATVVRKRGSAPRGIGARMFFMDNGHKLGTVGGGLAELEVCRLAEQCKQDRRAVMHSFDLANGEAGKSGMICGGQIDVLFEVVE